MTKDEKQLSALVDALDKYIYLLGQELTDCLLIAHVHGWKSTRYDEGKKMRQEIAKLRSELSGGKDTP